MPIGIDNQNLFQNSQFQQFVDFAESAVAAGKQKAIARVNDAEAGPLAGRTIQAAKGEFVGNVGRSLETRDANNLARELFRKAIADMFHGESNIPMSVLDAMKLADFDKGKPLTARRIIAVKHAVDQFAGAASQNTSAASEIDEKIRTGIEGSLAKIGPKRRSQAEPLVKIAIEACNRDPDAVDFVKTNITKKIIYTSTSDFRTEGEIRKMVGDLVSNLDELRTASKGDSAIFAAGKEMLMLHGKALPKGAITEMIEAARQISIDDIRNLSASSSAKDIHKAVTGLIASLDDAMDSWGADKHLEGAEEMAPVRSFLTGALLSRCNQVTLRNIHDALHSDTARQLLGFYHECRSTDNPYVEGQSEDIRKGVTDIAVDCDVSLRMLDNEVSANIARMNPSEKPSPLPYIEDEVDLRAIGGKGFVNDIIASANDSNARKVKKHVDATVAGSGKGAEIMRNILQTTLDCANEPEVVLGKRLGANANAMMNWNICSEMKKIAADGGEKSQFKKDIYRSATATLTDGKTTIHLTRNFETARDELTQFVTGDPKATYRTIVKDEDRNKVHLLMAMISQETEKAAETGVENALDKRESDLAFTMSGFMAKEKQGSRTYSIQKLDDGGITMHYVMDKPINEIDDRNTDGKGYKLGEGSEFTCTLDYTLDGEEFNRLANLDYGKFDGAEGDRVFNRLVDMPDGSRKLPENRLEKVVDTFAQDFRINADCKMDFTMKLEPSDQDLIDAQR